MPDRWTDDGRVNYGVYPGEPLTLIVLVGNKDFMSEELIAYEAGYRVQPNKKLSLDAVNIESYVTLDARLAWKPRKNIELSLVGST